MQHKLVFLARARRALEELAGAAVDARRAARGETGRLQVGFIGSALLELLPRLVPQFGAAHPEVALELYEMSSSGAGRELTQGKLDVIVTRGAPRGRGAESLVSVALGGERMVAAVGLAHPLRRAGDGAAGAAGARAADRDRAARGAGQVDAVAVDVDGV